MISKILYCRLLSVAVIMLTMTLVAFGQDTTAVEGLDPSTYSGLEPFIDGVNWVYSGLVVIMGYFSSFIPGIKNIKDSVYRVLALAIVVGAGFLFFDAGSSLFSLIISYTVSTSFYEVILKLIKKSPKPDEVPA